MKSKATAFWCVLSILLATAMVVQWNYSRKQRTMLEKLQLQVEKGGATPSSSIEKPGSDRVQELEKGRLQLIGELRAAEFELNSMRMSAAGAARMTNEAPGNVGKAGPATAASGAGGGGMAKMLGNMLKDPEMRKALEQQQRMGMDMIYGSLFKDLQLTPEEEEKFKDLLIAQQMDNMSNAGTLFDQNADRTKLAQELGEKHRKNEEQLKALLGEDKFAQYQDYNQTMGERMMLDQIGRTAGITPEQNEQLLGLFREEKRNVQANFGGNQADPTRDWQSMLTSGEASKRLMEQQNEVNQRVLERAGQVLAPDQLQKFRSAMKAQQEMQAAGMKIAE